MCRLLMTLLALAAPLISQSFLLPGDIIIASSQPNSLAVTDPGGGNPVDVPIPLGPVLGVANETPTAIAWDPSHPDDVILGGVISGVGGDGYLVRATLAPGGGSTATVLVAPGGLLENPGQISFDQNGDLIVVDRTLHAPLRVDPVTGAMTQLTSNLSSFGQIRSGMVDGRTGDIFLGTTNAKLLLVAPSGGGLTATVTLIASGVGNGGSVLDLTIDPLHPGTLAFVTANSPRIPHRYDFATQTMTPFMMAPAPGFFSSIRADEQGRYVVSGGTNATLWRFDNPASIPVNGLSPTLLGNANPSFGVQDVAVAGALLDPAHLQIATASGGGATFQWMNFPPVTMGWTFLSTTTFLPEGIGPMFGIVPDIITFSLFASTPTPAPGNPLHFLGAPPPMISFPAGSFSGFAGQTWDFVSVALGPTGLLDVRTNVERVTFQ